MKNIETLNALIAANVALYRATCEAMRENVKTLENVYGETITSTPAETVARFVKAVGYTAAVETIATLINRHAWDGRICNSVKAWAVTVEGAYDEEAAERMWIFTNRIHMAHLDQLAEAMKDYEPETQTAEEAEPAEVTEEPEAETTEEEQEAETMNANELFARIREEVEARTTRSAWSHGVEAYALDLVDELEEATEGGYFDLSDLEAPEQVNRAMLNGARDWNQYSWGGSSLYYDGQIAERLCTPSELKKTRNGERRPNRNEEWLDVQARALFQASNRVKRAIRAALEA